jgi:radical SAM superfamily enzyme YgiQ (UPF0313 family)
MDEIIQTKRPVNLGNTPLRALKDTDFPNADAEVHQAIADVHRPPEAVDVLLVNPPTPDGGLWIRSQHRVGRRTRENMIWPQVDLAQMAALIHPPYSFKIIDSNAEDFHWGKFIELLDRYQPRYYLTQVTAPTLENDMYGVFLAKARGARTIGFGTHVTPIPEETLRAYPALDYILYGEPDLTLRDLIDHLEGKVDQRSPEIQMLIQSNGFSSPGAPFDPAVVQLSQISGLVWRKGDEVIVNRPRPFIANLDDLPIPLHEALPLSKYRMPLIKGPFTFIVTSRGCPAGCTFCIKHVSYQNAVRIRSPQKIMEELWALKKLGIHNIHMYADLFTVSREQVMALCQMMIDQKIHIRWTANSRVDYVDQEMLALMGKAGCWLISWGIESGNEQILKHVHKGIDPEKVARALTWSKQAGIMNWGYFIIGLPGETEATIRETIAFAKRIPLDIALFHIAAPHPGTPFFFEVVREGWFKPGTRWEQVDMDKETVLNYPGLSTQQLMYWQKRAFREWAFRPGPMFTYLRMLLYDFSTLKSALSVGLQTLRWQSGAR